MSAPVGIKSIGYTNDGLVFFQIVTTYEGQPLETTIQFGSEDATNFCKNIMQAVAKAKDAKEVSH